MNRINRIQPVLPAQAYKTFQIIAPGSTHFRPGTCEEAGCGAYERGWRTLLDETSDLGQQRAHYIRKLCGRRFAEERDPEGLTVFTFEPGQRCFAQHRVPLERESFYFVRGGDWRGNPLGGRPFQHRRGEEWVEDFAEHQARLNAAIERG